MSDNFSESKHIASLDFEISKIPSTFEEINKLLEAEGIKAQKIINDNFNLNNAFKTNAVNSIQGTPQQALQQVLNSEKSLLSLYSKSASLQADIRKNKQLSAVISEKELSAIRKNAEQMFEQYKSTGKITDEMREQTAELQKQLGIMSTSAKVSTYDNPVVNNKSMLSEIASKAKWYLAGSAAFAGGFVAKETIKTITDVEYKVMEITRVMNDASLNVEVFRSNLFNLAVDYGRSFEDVAEVALRFAQAGYNVNDTIKMTKDSLLALNTAELNVENSTQSMIGIMQQWGYSASELSTIIDKLNYTADNNAITTQDLVDGLLNASSVAKTANMSFNDTVGVLTALKEASGRSGKEVGNAFKSILSYIQRPMSLKGFDEMGIDVFANKATGELLPMMEILQNMSNKWNGMSSEMQDAFVKSADEAGLFSEELAIATDTMDEYTALTEAQATANNIANDAETRAQASLAAGIYRRNYYIALMGNFNKALQVSADMQNAEGYSMRENSKHMDTLQAKYNALISALKNLAVEAGDSGLVGLAKGALDLATALTKVSSNAFGMSGILAGMALTYTLLSKEAKIFSIYSAASWKEMGAAILAAGAKLKAYATGQQVAKTTTETTTATIALQNAALTFGLSIAIQGIIWLFQKWSSENQSVVATMKEINAQTEQSLKSIQDNKTAKEAEIATAEKYIGTLEELQKSENGLAGNKERVLYLIEQINKILPDANLKYNAQTGAIEGLNTALTNNIELMRKKIEMDANSEQLTTYLKAEREAKTLLEEKSKKALELEDKYNQAVASGKYFGSGNQMYIDKSAVEFAKAEASAAQKAYNEAKKTADDFFNSLDNGFKQTNEQPTKAPTVFDNFINQYKNADEAVKSVTTSVKDLESAMQAMNTGEGYSVENALALLSKYPQLAETMQMVGDKVYFNVDALNAERQALYNNMLMQETANFLKAQSANIGDTQKNKLVLLAEAINTATTATARQAAITEYLNYVQNNVKASTDDQKNALNAYVKTVQMLSNVLGNTTFSYDGKGSTVTSNTQSRVKALQAESKKLDEEYNKQIKSAQEASKEIQKSYNDRISKIKETAQAEIDALKDIKNERERDKARSDVAEDIEYWSKRTGVEATDKLKEAVKKQAEQEEDWLLEDRITAIEKSRDSQVKALEEERDAIIERYETEIEALQVAQEESKKKYEADIENAQNAGTAIMGVANDTANHLKGNSQDIADTITQHAKSVSTQIRSSINDAISAIDSYEARLAEAVSYSEKTRLFNQQQADLSYYYWHAQQEADGWRALREADKSITIPSSHTGSIVAKEGLVNVAPGEVIIRPDITAGLLKMMKDYNQRVASATNNSFVNSNTNNGTTLIQNFNAPLSNIEKQEINDGADRQLSENQINRALTKALSKVTK